MENDEIMVLLNRIAGALESIANSLESRHRDSCLMEPSDEGANAIEVCENHDVQENVGKEKDGSDVIKKFLDKRRIGIRTVPPEDASDEVINSLSEFLGNNYDGLRGLLAKIKRNMQQGRSMTLSLKGCAQKDISNICQFCARLHEVAFLEQYKYHKSPQYLIRAKTTTLPAAQNFFSGKWLERYVLLSVKRAVALVSRELDKEFDFSYLLNPQVVLPNGDDFELDLMFHVNEEFFWIEAKSGDYQQHISKYSRMSRTLNLDFEHSMMVLADISADRSSALSSMFSMTVLSLSQLEEKVIEVIKKGQIA